VVGSGQEPVLLVWPGRQMSKIERRNHDGTKQQPEKSSGTGLEIPPWQSLSYAGAPQGTQSTEQRDSLMPLPDTGTLERTEPRVREPQKTGAESPFLNALRDSMLLPIYQHTTEVLIKEDEDRRKRAIERTKQWQRDNPEAYRKKEREKKARQRARKKQEAKS